jgi:ABC-type uncharacterized transport system permease subunit
MCEDARMTVHVWSALAALAYVVAAVLFTMQLGARTTRAPGLVAGLTAVAAHTAALHQQLIVPVGLNLGFFQVASLVGWQVAIVVLLAASRLPVTGLAVLTFPVIAVAALAPQFVRSASVVADLGWRLEVHILLSLLAYSLLAVAAIQALLLAAQDRQLRRHRPGGWVRALPPLEAMESLLFRLIGWGFVLLGLALFTGFLFVDDILAQHLVHKTALSVLAWLLFGVLLWGRWRWGWRGRLALRLTVGAFALLLLSYFGSKLVLELILGRRWG